MKGEGKMQEKCFGIVIGDFNDVANVINKFVKKQRRMSRKIALLALITAVYVVASERHRKEQNIQIATLRSEVQELKRTKGD